MDQKDGNNAFATARANLEADLTKGTAEAPQTQAAEQTEEAKPVDLKQLGKFVFEGKEVTYDDLKKSHMLQSDYTRKTQEIASERKYVENLSYDLDHLAGNPNLLAQFKQVYPEKYHSAADKVAAIARGKMLEKDEQPSQRKEKSGLEPQVIEEINQIKQRLDMTERQKASVVIDKIVGELSGKYELADPDMVQAKAAFIMQQTGQFLPLKEWENLFKESHVQIAEKSTKYFKLMLEKQKQANRNASDSSAGGMVIGKTPARNFDEAREGMLKDLMSRKA